MSELETRETVLDSKITEIPNDTDPLLKAEDLETGMDDSVDRSTVICQILQDLVLPKNEDYEASITNLFRFTPKELSSYLMQIIHLYLYQPDLSEMLFVYLSRYTHQDLYFSLMCTWFLEAYLVDTTSSSHACIELVKKLLNSILISFCAGEETIGDRNTNILSDFISERNFITELVLISRRLRTISTKSSQTHRLHSELLNLDRSISQIAFIPITTWPYHIIVRIPFQDSSVLNSKDKAPFLLYVEVIERSDNTNNTDNVFSIRKREFENIAKSTCVGSHVPFITLLTDHSTGSYPTTFSDGTVSESTAIEPENIGAKWRKVSLGEVRKRIVKSNSQGESDKNDDPSANVLSEPWKVKRERIRQSSPYGNIEGWNLYAVIIKYGDDLRQDYLAFQILNKCQEIWNKENLLLWVKPYCVVITESQAGLIEAIIDAVSIHQIKCKTHGSLEEYFKHEYGDKTHAYCEAKHEFVRSLAGYSLFQYIFQVKDRHNGNILVDREGHIIHIDFGYILGQSPKNISFEASPFKMSQDFMELLEGLESQYFTLFRTLLYQGFKALRRHAHELMVLVNVMKIGLTMACIGKNGQASDAFNNRFVLNLDDSQLEAYIDKLIYQSVNSYTTILYDKFQYYTNGIRI